jgi:hypothetical protein
MTPSRTSSFRLDPESRAFESGFPRLSREQFCGIRGNDGADSCKPAAAAVRQEAVEMLMNIHFFNRDVARSLHGTLLYGIL